MLTPISSDFVHSVTFSRDSKILASVSDDLDIKRWDSNSSQCAQALDINKFNFVKSFDTTNQYHEILRTDTVL